MDILECHVCTGYVTCAKMYACAHTQPRSPSTSDKIKNLQTSTYKDKYPCGIEYDRIVSYGTGRAPNLDQQFVLLIICEEKLLKFEQLYRSEKYESNY